MSLDSVDTQVISLNYIYVYASMQPITIDLNWTIPKMGYNNLSRKEQSIDALKIVLARFYFLFHYKYRYN